MPRKSKRELERALEDLDRDRNPPEEPPQPWMGAVPRRLWTDHTAAWRYYIDPPEDESTPRGEG